MNLPKRARGVVQTLYRITGQRPLGCSSCCACATTASLLVFSSFCVSSLSFGSFPNFRSNFPAVAESANHKRPSSGHALPLPTPGTRAGFRAHPSFPTHAARRRRPLTPSSPLRGLPLGPLPPTVGWPVEVPPLGLPLSANRSCGCNPCGGSGSCGRRGCCSCCRSSDSESPPHALRPEP